MVGLYLRIIRIEVLLKLMAGAGGDFVNTWTNHFYVINHFVPVLYLAKADTNLLGQNAALQICTRESFAAWWNFPSMR